MHRDLFEENNMLKLKIIENLTIVRSLHLKINKNYHVKFIQPSKHVFIISNKTTLFRSNIKNPS